MNNETVINDTEKFSIVLFSGTVDKLMAAVTLATGAAMMDKKVNIFLTFAGVMALRKDDWKTNTSFSPDFEQYAVEARKAMEVKRVPPWLYTLQGAMEIGDVTLKACSATMDLFDMKLEDLEPVVTEISGVASFVEDAEGGTTLFI